LLIANLLFSQVAVNLLHNDHPRQRSFTDVKNGCVQSKAAVKHCKVCSLDIVFNLLFEPASIHDVTPVPAILNCVYNRDAQLAVTHFLWGRAPPVSLLR
jgi:hypothetical protein